MILQWTKCVGEIWCSLGTVNLGHAHFENLQGVYVIWHGGQASRTVYVGQGTIKERLLSHRTDPRFAPYAPFGLFVTWAAVDAFSRDGVEIYLASTLAPIVGDRHAAATPIPVNLPWAG
jgi:hypothetical protein